MPAFMPDNDDQTYSMYGIVFDRIGLEYKLGLDLSQCVRGQCKRMWRSRHEKSFTPALGAGIWLRSVISRSPGMEPASKKDNPAHSRIPRFSASPAARLFPRLPQSLSA